MSCWRRKERNDSWVLCCTAEWMVGPFLSTGGGDGSRFSRVVHSQESF